ncbi:MAG: hypothetical protein AW09_002918 [Candidatus Accumulibacter phosphatis]|uniref:Uncharacterized protein n=1 Tax=Candidatus Accumulibacter phosphatis TaxID=327160 RepID=A0A080LW12_9PROT|nr:MAG: hypothetical protein AW09_002918 [Candidatus Accumulibacter phosphatis]
MPEITRNSTTSNSGKPRPKAMVGLSRKTFFMSGIPVDYY